MEILIKGLEMPKSCGNCKFSQFHEANPWTTWYTCLFSNKDIDDTGNGRLVGCPLISVPEHGDLGDLSELSVTLYSELEAHAPKTLGEVMMIIKKVFDNAPVVLERTT